MDKVRLKRNVYIILAAILLLGVALQVTNSKYILQFNHNRASGSGLNRTLPAAAQAQPAGNPYCIVFDSQDDFSEKLKTQTQFVLGYMKKPVRVTDARSGVFHPDGCQAVISALTELDLIGDIEQLGRYIENGGYVFQETTPSKDDAFYRLYRKMGIVNAGNTRNAQGVHLTSNVLIGEQDLHINDSFMMNTIMEVELDGKSRVLAKTAEGAPLLWDFPLGKGKFMVFNGTILQEKLNRGMIAGAISMLEPVFVYPIFNSKIVYLDDFPSPIPTGNYPVIYNEYHKSTPSFYKEIWWPDMLALAKQSNVKYTAVLIESYQQIMQPPFASPSDKDLKGLISYGREVLKSGGEIGLHGYNHQSLVLDQNVADEYEYKAWGSVEDMAQATAEALNFARSSFPKYELYSYVPPSNVLSPEGREAIKKYWPSLAVIASLYPEDERNLAYVQEYSLSDDGILEMPRITSDYTESDFQRWLTANSITTHGIFSHFIHPDDLISTDRNDGLTWEKMYENITDRFERIHQTYPWMRAMTSAEAALDMKNELTSQVTWTIEGNQLHGRITPFQGQRQAFFIARKDRKIGKLHGCKVEKIDTNTYLITANESEFDIELGG